MSPIDRLKAAVTERNLTLQQVARALAVDQSTVSRWLSTGKPPYARNLSRLERYLASLASSAVEETPQGYAVASESPPMVAPYSLPNSGPSSSPTPEDCESLLADTLRLAERLPGGVGTTYQKIILLRHELEQVARALHPNQK